MLHRHSALTVSPTVLNQSTLNKTYPLFQLSSPINLFFHPWLGRTHGGSSRCGDDATSVWLNGILPRCPALGCCSEYFPRFWHLHQPSSAAPLSKHSESQERFTIVYLKLPHLLANRTTLVMLLDSSNETTPQYLLSGYGMPQELSSPICHSGLYLAYSQSQNNCMWCYYQYTSIPVLGPLHKHFLSGTLYWLR